MIISLSRTSRKLQECARPTSSISVWCNMWPTSIGKQAASPPSTEQAEWLSSAMDTGTPASGPASRPTVTDAPLLARLRHFIEAGCDVTSAEAKMGRISLSWVESSWDKEVSTADRRRASEPFTLQDTSLSHDYTHRHMYSQISGLSTDLDRS